MSFTGYGVSHCSQDYNLTVLLVSSWRRQPEERLQNEQNTVLEYLCGTIGTSSDDQGCQQRSQFH